MKNKGRLTGFQVFILGILSAFGPLALDLYLPGLPMLQKELHTTPSMAQLSITAAMIGLALGQVMLGPLSDQIGRKKPLVYGVLIFSITSFGIALTDQISILILLRFIQGLSGSAGIVLSLAIITDSFQGVQLTKNVAINQAINGLFPILAPVLGGVLIAVADWRSTFWFLAILALILVGLILWKMPETNQNPIKVSFKSTLSNFKDVFKNKRFVVMMFVQAFMMSALFAYIAGSSFVLQDMYGLSVSEFSLVYALNGFGILVAAFMSGKLASLFSAKRLLGWFMLISILGGWVFALGLFITLPFWAILLAFLMIVAPVGGINSLTTAIAMQHIKHDAGTASGLLGLMRFLMGGLMSPIVGIGGTHTMVPLILTIMVVQFLGGLCYHYYQRQFDN